ncbi:MAG: HPP family protein [Gordonibacter urolithinfaciens]
MNRTIGDIMERDVYTCRYDQNLGEIVALFNDLGTSGLAVIDEDRHVVGFISDGDIMKAVAAQKTRSIFGGGYANMVLYDNESFEEKARAPASQRHGAGRAEGAVRHGRPGRRRDRHVLRKEVQKVPVIDEDGRLIGMVRRATITRCLFDVLFGEESAGE